MRRIAAFLDVPLDDAETASVVRESQFELMRELALQEGDMLAPILDGGSQRFFFKGTNGRWRDVARARVPRLTQLGARSRVSSARSRSASATGS